MNHKKFWTVVALVTSFAGAPLLGRTETVQQSASEKSEVKTGDVVKVGEYQPQEKEATVTKIHTHTVNDKAAATLYVRNIPVITFIGSSSSAQNGEATKLGAVGESDDSQTKAVSSTSFSNSDPVQRASKVAVRVNDLVRGNLDATKIAVAWKSSNEQTVANKALDSGASPSAERYEIKVDGKKIVEINENTVLAGTTDNLATDALQATNRLRRLMGGAEPISKIDNLPQPEKIAGITLPQAPQEIASRRVRSTILGIASFYWQGQKTATGERYNPHGLTAAHRSLPFGTRVRVTNRRNGRSVIVRINDRGPFIRGRVIDLSLGAAKAIGMVKRGLAPVKVEVLGR